MVQHTTTIHAPEEETIADESVVSCCHHWVIQPADGPSSNGACQVCGETREFKNYVESATWGDGRTAGRGSSTPAASESTSDDDDSGSPGATDNESEPAIGPDASEMESED